MPYNKINFGCPVQGEACSSCSIKPICEQAADMEDMFLTKKPKQHNVKVNKKRKSIKVTRKKEGNKKEQFKQKKSTTYSPKQIADTITQESNMVVTNIAEAIKTTVGSLNRQQQSKSITSALNGSVTNHISTIKNIVNRATKKVPLIHQHTNKQSIAQNIISQAANIFKWLSYRIHNTYQNMKYINTQTIYNYAVYIIAMFISMSKEATKRIQSIINQSIKIITQPRIVDSFCSMRYIVSFIYNIVISIIRITKNIHLTKIEISVILFSYLLFLITSGSSFSITNIAMYIAIASFIYNGLFRNKRNKNNKKSTNKKK